MDRSADSDFSFYLQKISVLRDGGELPAMIRRGRATARFVITAGLTAIGTVMIGFNSRLMKYRRLLRVKFLISKLERTTAAIAALPGGFTRYAFGGARCRQSLCPSSVCRDPYTTVRLASISSRARYRYRRVLPVPATFKQLLRYRTGYIPRPERLVSVWPCPSFYPALEAL